MLSKVVGASAGLLLAQAAAAQASYVGTVGTAPIELALNSVEDADLAGTYLYTRIGTPIGLGGQLKQGVLTLTERDARGRASATLTIPAFRVGEGQLTGTWRSLATGKSLPVTLAPAPHPGELLQATDLKDSYFKLVLASPANELYGRVVAVRVLAKKTNRLVQQLAVDCESHGVFSVGVGDYNFDGLPDFSVFESSYAGPNTSSVYFLYNPAARRFEKSGFAGTSLEFDAKKKRIYEHNSCCAGSSVTTAEYKLVRNRMVLLTQHCYRWDEKKQALVERKLSACQ